MDGPSETEPLRFAIPWTKLIDNVGSHFHNKNLKVQTMQKKKASVSDFKLARERTFSNLDIIAGHEVEGGIDNIRIKLANATANSEAVPALSSDVLRAGNFSDLLKDEEQKQEESGQVEKKLLGKGDSSASLDDDMDSPAKSPGSSPSGTKVPFFDRDRQVNAAQRSSTSSLESLKQALQQLQESITRGLASMDSSEEAVFQKEKSVLLARAKGIAAFFAGERDLEVYCRQFDYQVGKAKEGLAPPCRNYRELKPYAYLQQLVQSYSKCSTKEEVTIISKSLAIHKRPIISLQSSIRGTFEELQKARDLRKKHEKKRGKSDPETPASKKKKVGDVFENIQEVVWECLASF